MNKMEDAIQYMSQDLITNQRLLSDLKERSNELNTQPDIAHKRAELDNTELDIIGTKLNNVKNEGSTIRDEYDTWDIPDITSIKLEINKMIVNTNEAQKKIETAVHHAINTKGKL